VTPDEVARAPHGDAVEQVEQRVRPQVERVFGRSLLEALLERTDADV
jgi:hypothetical protein